MKDLFHNQSPLAARKFFSLVTPAQKREVDSAARVSFKAFDRAPSGHRWSGFLVWPAPLVFLFDVEGNVFIFFKSVQNLTRFSEKFITSPAIKNPIILFPFFKKDCSEVCISNSLGFGQGFKIVYVNQFQHTLYYNNWGVDITTAVLLNNKCKERAAQCRNTKRLKGSFCTGKDIGAQAA